MIAPCVGVLISALMSPAPAQQSPTDSMRQAYQQQLQENQQRAAYSDQGYQQQLQRNTAAQTYMPPVHISPPSRRADSGSAQSLNGRFNSVQNYAAKRQPTFTTVGDQSQQPAPRPVKRRARPTRSTAARSNTAAPRPNVQADYNRDEPHVFLQDRIASAFSKRLRSPQSPTRQKPPQQPPQFSSEVEYAPVAIPAPPTRQPNLQLASQPVAAPRPQRRPEPAIIRPRSQDFQDYDTVDQHYAAYDDSDFEIRLPIEEPDAVTVATLETEDTYQPTARGLDQPAVYRDSYQEIEIDAEVARIDRAYAETRVAQSSFSQESEVAPPVPHPDKSPRVARRRKRAAAAQPIAYSPTQNRLRASEVSVLVGQDNNDLGLENPDLNLPGSSTRSRPQRTEKELPPFKQSDDLDGFDDDRVRSRLDEDIDDLDDLDELDDDDDDGEDNIGRPRVRPCGEFGDELLSSSIRDISLDTSPPAFSADAVNGGLSRQWTDRSGNPLITATMVDLRRGYVILDTGQRLAYSKLSLPDLEAISEFWRLPTVCRLGNRGGSPYRNWSPQIIAWQASSLSHKPLYFENVQLERYGHSRGPFAQPIHSTLHFFTSLVSLPYQTAISPPNECEYALGYYRPGDCAPWLKEPVPISLEGATRQALLTTGAAFIP